MPCDRVEFRDEDVDYEHLRYPGCPFVPSPALSDLAASNLHVWEIFCDVRRFGWEGALALHDVELSAADAEIFRVKLRVLHDFFAQREFSSHG